MHDSRLKVAQVGVGNFGAYRRERLRETGLFELVAAYDLNAEFLAQAEREDGARPCDSYEELLSTPGIEAVIISTGAKYHTEQAVIAAERGLHVLVEKPLCSTPQEVEALLDVQRRSGVIMGVGHDDHQHRAASQTTKRMIDEGELGEIAAFERTTAHNGGLLIKPGDWRGDPEKNPGGMLFQCGVHALHELMFYFGPISQVGCMMRYDIHTTATADVAICNLKFASGLVGTLNAYHVAPYRHKLNIFGTKANLYRKDASFDEAAKLWKQRTHLDYQKEPQESISITGEDDNCGNVRSFYHAIRSGTPLYPSLEDGARAVAVVFAAEAAAISGKTVDVMPIAKS